MAFKIPKRKKILGEWWTTKRKWGLRTDEGVPAWGLCSHLERVIYLDRAIPKKMECAVYLHEEGHALLYELGVTDTSMCEDIEEIIVEGFAKHFSKSYDLMAKKK